MELFEYFEYFEKNQKFSRMIGEISFSIAKIFYKKSRK